MQWHYVKDGATQGPVNATVLATLEAAGMIGPETLVWREGMGGWEPLKDLRAHLPQPQPKSPPAPAPEAAPVPKPAPAAAEPEAPREAADQRCSECGKYFRPDELLRYKDLQICPNCKPAFLQRVKDGRDEVSGLDYASIGARFGARVVDGILFQILSTTMRLILGLGLVQKPGEALSMTLLMLAFNLLTIGVYEVVMTAQYGGTLGKLALGIRVCDEDGTPLTMQRSFYRYMASMLSALTCLIGYLIAFNHPKKQALHDRLVGTVVVRK
jgi:uncharacterized RDD family membrane protein YckC